jgi:hypothetical protein
MGCFSSVCAVSKLPIYGHPIVGIPLLKNKSTRRTACYPNADWELDGFPFFGENDGYGRIEDFEKGKYHKLNLARYGVIPKEMIDQWSQPQGDQSIMYIHRSIWDQLMVRWSDQATIFYKDLMKMAKEEGGREQEIWKKTIKRLPDLEDMLDKVMRKVPAFRHDGIGISFNFSQWCNEHYQPAMKKALLDLVTLSISCTYTHTLYASPWTLGEQISDWKEEAKWQKFVAKFASETYKKQKEETCYYNLFNA